MKRNIQKDILVNLLGANGLRYSEAKPKGVENDLYNYHLQFLVDKGFVEKKEDLYYLSESGKKFVEEAAPLSRSGELADTFRVSVLLIVTRKINGKLEVLNQTRKRHPYFGEVGLLSGKVKKEELILDAAKRKLFEEANLVADFKNIGLIRKIRVENKSRELISDSFWFVCIASNPKGILENDNKYGFNTWVSLEESIANEKTSTQGSLEISSLLEKLKFQDSSNLPFNYIEEKIYLTDF